MCFIVFVGWSIYPLGFFGYLCCFAVGDNVRMTGFVRSPAVNGMAGTLREYRGADRRWKVELNSGEVFWVKPKNIEKAVT